ncbi:MAG TPA: S1 RNA-binding domain-containing protein [Longilinea sp.]|nr:S1 RNA-binding domain-containing protein [Longilinea sp.]
MGKVVKISLAGALVDIGVGHPAYLHVSQMVHPADLPIKQVEDILKVGQEIEVWIKKNRPERIELTMMKPLDLEWRDIKQEMVVKGTVVRLEKWGAFVEIGAERPGLIHISEMAHGYVRQPSDVVKEGDELEAKVIDVNRKKKQIKLSIKALQPEPVKEEEPSFIDAAPARKDRPARRPKKNDRKARTEFNGGDEALLAEMAENKKAEAEPTAMEMAMREAMDKARTRRKNMEDKASKAKISTQEQEEILSRTLENKVQTA